MSHAHPCQFVPKGLSLVNVTIEKDDAPTKGMNSEGHTAGEHDNSD